MKKYYSVILIGSLLLLSVFVPNLFAKDLCTITINGVIGPPVAGFIKESIEKCSTKGGEALLILLDTPGGLDTSMRDIIKNIMDSSVPVIVYVYPPGARAASAGAIILLSSHIAAMAPGTNVGAAHPVTIGKEKVEKEVIKKAVQDAEAYARSIAMKKGRNVEWAAKAVRESSSITAKDALEKRVIDVMADNVDDLLAKIDGKTVDVRGTRVALKTKSAPRVDMEMPMKYRFLSYITDPNVAYILMMMGIYGILFEIYSPGRNIPRRYRRYINNPRALCVPGNTDQLRRARADFSRRRILYSGGEDHKPRAAGHCGRHINCDRLYHAYRPSFQHFVHIMEGDTCRGNRIGNLHLRCPFLCSAGPVVKSKNRHGRAHRRDGLCENRCFR